MGLALVLVGTVAWVGSRSFSRPVSALGAKVGQGAGQRALGELVVKRTQERRLASAESVIAEKNALMLEERRRFEAAGWNFVEGVVAPDAALVELDPELLANGKREAELQTQIQSNAVAGEQQLERLRKIALRASGEAGQKTRAIAIDALARSEDPKAQAQLIELYRELVKPTESGERQQILSSLRPRGLADPTVDFLVDLIADPLTSESTRRQAALPLAWMARVTAPAGAHGQATARAAREATEDELVRRMPRHWQDEFRKLSGALAAGGAQ